MTILTAGDYDGLFYGVFTFGDPPIGHRVLETTPSLYSISDNLWNVSKFHGSGFTYDAAGNLTGGVVTGWEAWGPMYIYSELNTPENAKVFSLEGFSVPGATLAAWIVDRSAFGFDAGPVLLAGQDSVAGRAMDDNLRGYDGDDVVFGGDGDDTLYGGGGVVDANDGSDYLRGDDGDDQIYGGSGFDDINGNRGDDTCNGGSGGDWVVGGQGDDLLAGEYDDGFARGDDVVLGNLGNDTCDGAAGADTLRGGQGDDSLTGGTGADWLSGDRGSDTLSGGAGADVFHSFGEAGFDRVLDFNRAEGDRVQLDPGTAYTVSEVETDVLIDMAGGARMVLAGVSMASLTQGWIGAA
jgi:serralysin